MTLSLRARLGLASAAVVGVILLAAGLALVQLYAADQRSDIDEDLDRQVRGLALTAGLASGPRRAAGQFPVFEDLSDAFNARVRVTRGEETVLDVGPGAGAVPPELEALDDGLATTTIDGSHWRFAAQRPAMEPDAVVQLGRPLAPVEESIAAVRRIALAVGLAALAAALATGWWLGGRLTGPLSRLGRAAAAITTTSELHRRVPAGGPAEVSALAESINTMLSLLDASATEAEGALEASRAFAASVAHELRTPLTSIQANLEYLYGRIGPGEGPGDGERAEVVADIAREQARVVDLLDGLRLLSLGDTPGALPWREVDVAELVDERVQIARRRYPGDTIELAAPDEPVPLRAWAQGLAAVVDNLVANALTHGRRGGRPASVRVTLTTAGDRALWLIVDDDGPGIPSAERGHVFGRFARGATVGASGSGSGLGLALVAQQAALHGGRAWAAESPVGGARLVVELARTGTVPHQG